MLQSMIIPKNSFFLFNSCVVFHHHLQSNSNLYTFVACRLKRMVERHEAIGAQIESELDALQSI